MKYAIKVTYNLLGFTFTDYIGRRGEHKKTLDKVEGWKKRSTAEQHVQHAVRFDEFSGFEGRTYEIITL